jgi:hypothetical protein
MREESQCNKERSFSMVAYTMDEIVSKGTRKAVKLHDLQKLRVVPINKRDDPNKEISLVGSSGSKRYVSREEIKELGYTYTDGSEVKTSRLSSKFSVYVTRPIKEKVDVVYIPRGRYVEHKGKKITDKYIIVSEDGSVGTCNKKVFRKLYKFLPDVKYDNVREAVENKKNGTYVEEKKATKPKKKASKKDDFLDDFKLDLDDIEISDDDLSMDTDSFGVSLTGSHVSKERYTISAKVGKDNELVGYLVENSKTGKPESMTIDECVKLVRKGKIDGRVKVVKDSDGNEVLGGQDIVSLQYIES